VADRWKCGQCDEVEGRQFPDSDEVVKVDVVCHHCGKPLCQRHRRLRIDEGFSRKRWRRRERRPHSVHCTTCQDLPGHRLL
jgi:hypothetical protein